jgi:hypothetical protein
LTVTSDVTRLRLDSFARQSAFRGPAGPGGAAWNETREAVDKALASSRETGCVHVLEQSGGVVAAVLIWREAASWTGVPAVNALIEYDLPHEGWVLDRLHEEARRFTDESDVTVHAHQQELLRWFVGQGLRIDAVILLG